MTRTFNEKIRCPKCRHEHTAETDFERWFRGNKNLDSRDAAVVRFDLDILLHKYIVCEDGKGTRDLQCMMFVEVKTFMSSPSPAQVDTLSILNQVLRNRRRNIHGKPRKQIAGQITKVASKMLKKDVRIKLFGGHLLQLDDASPDTSSRLLWDYHEINQLQLIELLRFERDPDAVHRTMDHRRRSKNWTNSPRLFE